jgi:hypothetical protein
VLLDKGLLVLSHVRFVVLDEADTLYEPRAEFGPLLDAVLLPIKKRVESATKAMAANQSGPLAY